MCLRYFECGYLSKNLPKVPTTELGLYVSADGFDPDFCVSVILAILGQSDKNASRKRKYNNNQQSLS